MRIALANIGIAFQHLCPHTHNQKGKIEHKHKHITKTTLSTYPKFSTLYLVGCCLYSYVFDQPTSH